MQIVTIYRNGVGAATSDGLQRFLSDQLYRSDKQLRLGPALFSYRVQLHSLFQKTTYSL